MNGHRVVAALATALLSAGCFVGGPGDSPAEAAGTTTTAPPSAPPTTTLPATTSSTATTPTPTATTPTTTTPTTTTPTTTATASPAQVLASAIFAAAGQRALDWRQTVTEGVDSYTQMTQAGRRDGTSAITVRVGKVVLRLNWALIGKTVYFTGNANALSGALGFTPSAAKQEAGKWISVTAAAGDLFSELSSYLTVSSITTSLDLVGEMTLLPATTVRGQAVLGIQGIRLSEEEKVTETIYVRATGAPLPVELRQTGQGATGYTYFGPWGQPPRAKAPQGALKLSKTWLASS
ncbi:MAG: hypothetical protein ACLP7F_23410 [Acidimicrobiales bacterium]